MRLAIFSDSHDNLNAIKYWVEYYNQNEADFLLHAGDFISPFTVPVLNRFQGPVFGVFGNNDGDRSTLKSKASETDVTLRSPPATFDLNDCSVHMVHKPSDISSPAFEADLIVHGHTHGRKWSEKEETPIANPGETGGWMTETSSTLLVETTREPFQYEFNLIPAP